MNKKTALAVGAIPVGWTMMTAALDKPEWWFAALGIAGLTMVVGAVIWLALGIFRRLTSGR